jgi:8-oxo-dGTP pyrophosphatase MutT (NUDIX family)
MAARANSLARWLVRLGMTSVHRLLSIGWFVIRPRTLGVRAVAITPGGAVVLLRHSYARGWYLPGGGVDRGEDGVAAVLRELREEIGMEAHETIRPLTSFDHRPNYRRDHVDVFVVEGVRYSWRQSLEIEEVATFDPEALPPDTTAKTRAAIDLWREQRRRPPS